MTKTRTPTKPELKSKIAANIETYRMEIGNYSMYLDTLSTDDKVASDMLVRASYYLRRAGEILKESANA